MQAETSATSPHVWAVCAAVAPYRWRTFTAEMAARYVLGALDQILLLELVGAARTDSGVAGVEPADRGDDRLEPLVHLMAGFRWRDVTLTRLVQLLLDTLDQWWARRDELDRELTRLLDGS